MITVTLKSGRTDIHHNATINGSEAGINGFTVVTDLYYRAYRWSDVVEVRID